MNGRFFPDTLLYEQYRAVAKKVFRLLSPAFKTFEPWSSVQRCNCFLSPCLFTVKPFRAVIENAGAVGKGNPCRKRLNIRLKRSCKLQDTILHISL